MFFVVVILFWGDHFSCKKFRGVVWCSVDKFNSCLVEGNKMLVDFDGLTIIIGVVIYVFLCAIIQKKCKKERIWYVFLSIMFVYFMGVIKITLFPIYLVKGWPSNIYKSFNFIPFRGGISITDLQNLIMTIPLGIGMSFITKINGLKNSFLLGIITGITIETLQYLESFLSKGFTTRIIDINDIIFNCLGTVLGFIILYGLSKIFLNIVKDHNLNIFWRYVKRVCMNIRL